MAHPTDAQGLRDAVAAGVDIIAHTTIDPAGSAWSDELVRDMVARGVSVVPTLKLWGYELDRQGAPADVREGAMEDARREVEAFATAGGQLLFGTDVGYMTDYTTDGEFVELGKSGLDFNTVLAMLTINPAARMGVSDSKGTITPGKLADLTILDADPATDLTNFSRVRAVVRSGKLVWQR
jgi:imidazolonepropionase-like amidohydrolase